MKLEVKIQLLKFCSAVFNSLFLALGLSVAGCAVWILFGKGNFLTVLSSVELSTVAVGLLIIGGVVVSVSVVGCIGADGEHRFLLLTYLGFLIILVLGQLFVTLLLLINRNKIERSLDAAVDQIILQYGGSSSQDALMDNVQHYGECCGRTGPADWLKNSYIQSLNLTRPDVLPCSCFSSYRRSFNSSWCSELLNYTEPPYGRGNSSYDQGCRQTLSVWLQENALTILGMDVSLILIQVLQFVVMVYLYRAVGRKASLKRSNRLIDPDHAHLDHAQAEDPDYGEQNDASPDPNGGYIHTAYHHDNQNHNRVYLEPAQGYS
ncbi:CD82 antigen-like isoform X1 [Seriola dumerili]|uniref:CD82 antigen-like isoform X1 n=1 Tax=Seriola dumerili TaxID=41447 RepID=UPI000BBE6E78|nr:CD82 antigen-like isoform X1 [Seriola dumerili]